MYSIKFECIQLSLMEELEKLSQHIVKLKPSLKYPDFPWMNEKEYQTNDHFLRLHQEVLDFYKWISPSSQEMHLRYLFIYRLQNAVSLLWPKSRVFCHGSTMTSTCLPSSDLDFVVIYKSDTSDSQLLNMLNSHLYALGLFKKSEVIQSAKCPIIKGVEKMYDFHIDISLNNENGIFNIERNRSLLNLYPTISPILMVLKQFLYEHSLDSPFHGGISSNTLIQIIYFIIQNSSEEKRNNLGYILMYFYKFFGQNFNYITTGISTNGSGRLFSKIELNRINWKSPFTLSIEDPQIPGEFLGENAFKCPLFREICQKSYNALNLKPENGQPSLLFRIIKKPDLIITAKKKQNRLYEGYILGLFPNGVDPNDIHLNIHKNIDSTVHSKDKLFMK